MVNGFWYYPSDKYEGNRHKDCDADETYYDTEYYYNYVPLIIEEGEKRGRPKNKNRTKKRLEINENLKKMVFFYNKNKCSKCGKMEDLQIHHIDENPGNNALFNLELQCYSCHKKTHNKVRREVSE